MPLPAWLRWTGVGIFALAGGLLFWTFRSLGSNLTDTVVTRRAHTLVTHGPYRWVRHPFYDCAALLIVASSLVVSNWFLLLTGGLVLVLLVVRTRRRRRLLPLWRRLSKVCGTDRPLSAALRMTRRGA
jgi:protein-S-isoprenylcysteine O-methyltransferase Ste14